MAVADQVITDKYALYNGDSCEVLKTLPDKSIDLSVYSPPFCGLYNYSSSERDLSNCRSYDEFFVHYEFIVSELARITKPGRMTAVHVMDIPKRGANIGGVYDFPGDVIRLHERLGFEYWTRRVIWKEPLGVRNRTMSKGLAHKQIVDDSLQTTAAGADFLLQFRRKGENAVPVGHPIGLMSYAGENKIPYDLVRYRGHEGKQTENRYSHWIWRQYASCIWDDIRIDRVLPYRESKDPDDERHVHPLQLDVIERACVLWSNPGEVVLTPFMGVGSEVYGAVLNGRNGIGIELKPSYYKQAVKNLASIENTEQFELELMEATND
ncbi:MAG: DNA methyltransferase [Victivallaceae bacterium]|nr:DNA methyltransferase [Victivallaceae bacterium]